MVKHAMLFDSPQHGFMVFNLSIGGCKQKVSLHKTWIDSTWVVHEFVHSTWIEITW